MFKNFNWKFFCKVGLVISVISGVLCYVAGDVSVAQGDFILAGLYGIGLLYLTGDTNKGERK